MKNLNCIVVWVLLATLVLLVAAGATAVKVSPEAHPTRK